MKASMKWRVVAVATAGCGSGDSKPAPGPRVAQKPVSVAASTPEVTLGAATGVSL